MQKAFAYLRVSGKSQVDGDGFPRQLAAIQKYAAANGITIAKVFREKAVTGTTEWDGREAWLEMLAAIVSNGIRTILIEKLDRLARDLMVQEHIIADLRKRGIDLISVMEPDLCVDDPSRKLLRQIMGAIAEYDRAMTVLKLRGARSRMKAATGRCEGRKPFGHYEGEGAVIDQMKALRAEGLGFDRIAAAMNEQGLETRTRGRWHGIVINRILKASGK